MHLPLPDLAATERLGAGLVTLLRPGDAILLEGVLGAGKTSLVRALLRAALSNPALEVPSPTFTLVQSYRAPRLTIHHLDLWRLDGPDAVHELGWEEMREDVVLVEWPDRLGPLLPDDALTIMLHMAGGMGSVAPSFGDGRIGVLGDAGPKLILVLSTRRAEERSDIRPTGKADVASLFRPTVVCSVRVRRAAGLTGRLAG